MPCMAPCTTETCHYYHKLTLEVSHEALSMHRKLVSWPRSQRGRGAALTYNSPPLRVMPAK